MIEYADARRIALEFIRSHLSGEGITPAIMDHQTRDEVFGWVFFYNDHRVVNAGDDRHVLCGNEPVVVMRTTGEVFVLPFLQYSPQPRDVRSAIRAAHSSRNIDARIRALIERVVSE